MSRKARYKELKAASDSDFSAYTVALAREHLEDFPDHGPAWMLLGIALTELHRYDEARRALRKAIKLCPSDKLHFPYGQMGHVYDFKGDRKRAEAWYRRAIDADPEDAGGYIYLGVSLAQRGLLAEAEEAYRRATRCRKGCVDEAYLNLGFALRAQERFAEALVSFRKALELDPKYKAAKEAIRDVEQTMQFLERSG